MGKNKSQEKKRGYKYQKYNLKSDDNDHKSIKKSDVSLDNQQMEKKSKIPLNPFFLFEQFYLKERCAIVEKIESSNSLEYIHIEQDLLIENLFLKKFRIDSGFRLELYHNLNVQPAILRKAIRELLNLIENKHICKPFVELSPNEEHKCEEMKDQFLAHSLDSPQPNFLFISPLNPSEFKIKFFIQLWQNFMEQGLRKEALACESLIFEFLDHNYSGNTLFRTSSPYDANQNTAYYYFQAMSNICQNLSFQFLDYIEAERSNLLLIEEFQDLIDRINVLNVQKFVDEIIEHFKDLMPAPSNIYINRRTRSDILMVAALILFESYEFTTQIEMLNHFYGVEHVIQILQQDSSIYSVKEIIPDLPIWYQFGFLPELKPYLESLINQNEFTEEDINQFVLIKYICKGLLECNNSLEALELVYRNYTFLTEWKTSIIPENVIISPDQMVKLEIFNLFGEILSKNRNQAEFNFVISSLKQLISNTTEQTQKSIITVILSQIYRRKGDFISEQQCLDNLNVDLNSLMQNDRTNLFEIMDYVMPLKNILSENQDDNEKERRLSWEPIKKQSLHAFDDYYRLPNQPESYFIYGGLRKEMLYDICSTQNSIIDSLLMEKQIDFQIHLNQILLAQLMASFPQALRLAEFTKEFLTGIEDPQRMDPLYESQIFPNLYLGDYTTCSNLLQEGSANRPKDTYYIKYLALVNIIEQNYDVAAKFIYQLYEFDQQKPGSGPLANLKSLFQLVLLYSKNSDFDNIINSLQESPSINKWEGDSRAKFLFDIGLAIADLGFSNQGLTYFQQALTHVHSNTLHVGILNGIGSIYSDLQKIENAIPVFQEAIELNPKHATSHFNLAKMYAMKLDHIQSKQVLEDGEQYFSDMPNKLALFKTKIVLEDIFIHGMLNLNLVHDQSAMTHFRTSHQLIINMMNLSYLSNNTGLIFVELCNGLDCLLHSTLSSRIITYLEQTYNDFIPPPLYQDKGIQELWHGRDNNAHISIGKWPHLMENFAKEKLVTENDNSTEKSLFQAMRDEIFPMLSDEDLLKIKKISNKVAKFRNPSGHGDIINHVKFEKGISEILEGINELIVLIDKIFQSDHQYS